jgi:hypothetical protein
LGRGTGSRRRSRCATRRTGFHGVLTVSSIVRIQFCQDLDVWVFNFQFSGLQNFRIVVNTLTFQSSPICCDWRSLRRSGGLKRRISGVESPCRSLQSWSPGNKGGERRNWVAHGGDADKGKGKEADPLEQAKEK